jgi:flagellar biosynthesis protein FliR
MTVSILPAFAATFMLVFARVGTLVMLMPGIGDRSIPTRARLAFALLLTLVLTPIAQAALPAQLNSPELVLRLLFVEILIGLMLGTAVRVALSTMQLAGTVVAQQMGLSFSSIVDPTAGVQNPTIATFLVLVATAMIFAMDLHHLSIRGIHDSYAMLPPGYQPPMGDAAQYVLQTFVTSFKIGIQISAPFLVFAIVFNMGLGVLSRLMPALQIFFIAMPATVMIGSLILIAAIAVMTNVFVVHFTGVLNQLIQR